MGKTALISFIEQLNGSEYIGEDFVFNGVITQKDISDYLEEEKLQLRLCHQDGFKNGVIYAKNTGEITTFDEYYDDEYNNKA